MNAASTAQYCPNRPHQPISEMLSARGRRRRIIRILDRPPGTLNGIRTSMDLGFAPDPPTSGPSAGLIKSPWMKPAARQLPRLGRVSGPRPAPPACAHPPCAHWLCVTTSRSLRCRGARHLYLRGTVDSALTASLSVLDIFPTCRRVARAPCDRQQLSVWKGGWSLIPLPSVALTPSGVADNSGGGS